MTKRINDSKAPLDFYQQGLACYKNQDIPAALEHFKKAHEEDPADEEKLLALGRCQVATHLHQEAHETYQSLLKKPDCPEDVRIEARLALGDLAAGLADAEDALKKEPGNGTLNLLAAWLCYHQGFIEHTYHYFSRAVESGTEWDDDDMLNEVIRHTLSSYEYQDLETIYLDVTDRILEGIEKPVNRWMWLTMTISELLEDKRPQHRHECAEKLIKILVPDRPAEFLKNGRDELEIIIRDFARSETDAEFGLKILDEFNQSHYDKIARLLLGLELDHLTQFAPSFGLTPDIIQNSHFSTVLALLPFCIATDLLLLFSLSDKTDEGFSPKTKIPDPQTMSALITACMINFYFQIEKYHHSEKPPPESG
jgi:tetratricopeptide (TPR) repeat protein